MSAPASALRCVGELRQGLGAGDPDTDKDACAAQHLGAHVPAELGEAARHTWGKVFGVKIILNAPPVTDPEPPQCPHPGLKRDET